VRAKIDAEEALERVRVVAGDACTELRLVHGQVDLACTPERLVELTSKLRDDDGLRFEFFTFLSAVDRSEFADEPGGLELLIHLYSPDHVAHVNLHVSLDAEAPRCPTITGLFRGAEWQEREAHEMFGIDFEGHPALSNLLLPEDFEGHPLRKSFRLPSRFVKPWPGAKDPEEASAGGRG